MGTSLDPLRIRKGLGRLLWGTCGTRWVSLTHLTIPELGRRWGVLLAVTADDRAAVAFGPDGWSFASYAHDATVLRDAVYGDGWAYQVFAPPAHHVNIHPYTLHLYGRLDGQPQLPRFDFAGTI